METRNEEEDDVLSLCDLPDEKDDNTLPLETQQDDSEFHFCSLTEEPEMCAADDVFHQGRILPYCDINSRSVSSSEDRSSTGGRFSSRSSSSGGGGQQVGTRFSAANKQQRINSARKKTSAWDIFRPGLMISQPAEIDFQDLKNRYMRNSKKWGEKKKEVEEEKKKKKRSGYVGMGGCRCCSSDAAAVDAKVVVIKRSAAVRDGQVVVAVVDVDDEEKLLPNDNRTFQWLNKLSLQGQSG